MAAKKTTEAVEEKEVTTAKKVNSADGLKDNLIALANELIEQVRGKQVPNLNETIDRAIAIYEKVK
jgi:hypothetical protein